MTRKRKYIGGYYPSNPDWMEMNRRIDLLEKFERERDQKLKEIQSGWSEQTREERCEVPGAIAFEFPVVKLDLRPRAYDDDWERSTQTVNRFRKCFAKTVHAAELAIQLELEEACD